MEEVDTVRFEYLELHLKTIIFKHPVSLKACRDFIVENNIEESIETKKLLGIK